MRGQVRSPGLRGPGRPVGLSVDRATVDRAPEPAVGGLWVIHWHRLDPAKVERAVKILIVELYPGAQAIDGAGGDDGQDLRWCSPNGLVIIEVKSHTDRLTASRKRKIKKSLGNAAGHEPVRWELVTPLDPSPAELQWFDSLRASHAGVELIWRDRAWLDGQFARREHLRRMVEGSEYTLLQRAAEFDREQAVLAGGLSDLTDRVRVLSARADELSAGWGIDFAASDGGTTVTVSERFPGAAVHDPLRFTPVFDFPDDDPLAVETRASLDLALDYGIGFTVAQPYLQRIDVDASDETLRLLGVGPDGDGCRCRADTGRRPHRPSHDRHGGGGQRRRHGDSQRPGDDGGPHLRATRDRGHRLRRVQDIRPHDDDRQVGHRRLAGHL